MTHKQRVIKEAMIAMQDFITGDCNTPEEFNRFFRKLFKKVYEDAWSLGIHGLTV
jgi:hypothetical protein